YGADVTALAEGGVHARQGDPLVHGHRLHAELPGLVQHRGPERTVEPVAAPAGSPDRVELPGGDTVTLGQRLHAVDLLGERAAVGDDDPVELEAAGTGAVDLLARPHRLLDGEGVVSWDLGERAEDRDVGVRLEEHRSQEVIPRVAVQPAPGAAAGLL